MAIDIRTARVFREILVASSPASNPIAVVSTTYRETLHTPKFNCRMPTAYREVLTAEAPVREILAGIRVAHREVLYKVSDVAVKATYREILHVYKNQGPPALMPQVMGSVTLSLPMKTMAETISTERVSFLTSATAMQADPYGWPWSTSRAGQAVSLVAQASPISTQSVTRATQATSQVAAEAVLGDYPHLNEVYSRSAVSQGVMLVLQSLDIAHIPDSKEYVPQIRAMVVQGSDLTTLWTCPAIVGRAQVSVAQSLGPSQWPRSNTTARQAMCQVAVPRGVAMPISNMKCGHVRSQAVIATEMPLPVGRLQTECVVSQAVQARDPGEPGPMGVQFTAATSALVAVAADYPAMGSLLVRNLVPSVHGAAVVGTEYGMPAGMWSLTTYSQAATVYTQQADPAWYLPPSYLAAGAENIFVPQVTEKVAQARVEALPWSRSRVPQLAALATGRADYRPASSVATSGVTLSFLTSQVAIADQYDDPHNAQSTLTVAQAAEQVAQVTEYPSAHGLPTVSMIGLLVEQVSQVDTYPQLESLRSVNAVKQMLMQAAQTDTYPDPLGLHSPLSVGHVTEQVAELCSDYPDKDAPGSRVVVRSVMEQSVELCSYPDKDQPGSRVVVRQIRGQVAVTDPTLYVLPRPLRRQRVRIVCRVVYE